MIAQILLPVILIFLYSFKVPIWLIILTILFLYWIPKTCIIQPLQYYFPQVVFSTNAKEKIALTFDDMPDGSHREIIDVLDQYKLKATLFVISGQINSSNINDFVAAVKNGHQLGNHGDTNSAHFFKNESGLRQEIILCDRMIKSIYQKAQVSLPTTMVYRPGCGLFGPKMLQIVREFGYRISLGSVYPHDTMMISSTINYYYLLFHIQEGDVVIMHDRKWIKTMYQLSWYITLAYHFKNAGRISRTKKDQKR